MSNLSNEYTSVREGEKDRTWYRSERVHKSKLGWYFHTREGIEVGPYSCQFDAEVDLEALIGRIRNLEGASVTHAIHCQAVSASSGDYMITSDDYTGYLVEEGGIELLREARK